MNTVLTWAMIALLGFMSAGCAARPSDKVVPVPAPVVQQPAPKPPQGITTNQLLFTVVSDDDYYKAMKGDPFVTNQEKPGFAAIPLGEDGKQGGPDAKGGYMVLIAMGQRNTGGYAVKAQSVEDIEGKTRIVVTETAPKAGEMVAQMIAYPHIVIQTKGGTPNFEVVDTKGAVIPRLK